MAQKETDKLNNYRHTKCCGDCNFVSESSEKGYGFTVYKCTKHKPHIEVDVNGVCDDYK